LVKKALPQYMRIKESLIEEIRLGKYQPFETIPSELKLSEIFGVSRLTIRRALNELVLEGLLIREQGRGSYVTAKAIPGKIRLNFLATDFQAELIGNALAKAYMNHNDSIEINVLSAPYDAVPEHFRTEFICHQGNIDIIMVPFSFMSEYVLDGKLEILDQYIKNAGLDFSDYLIDSNGKPVIDNTCSFNIAGIGPRRFGIPFQNDIYTLVYRKDLFEKYNLSVPTTPDEYAQAARTLTGSKDNNDRIIPYGTVLNAKRTRSDFAEDFINFLWAFGGELFTDDFVPLINSPAGKKGLKFYKSLLEYAPPECINYNIFDSIRAMREGKVAMMMNWSSDIGILEDPNFSEVSGKLGYALFPPESPQIAGWELAIPYDSAHKEEAFSFIKFATGASSEVMKIYANRHILPYWRSVIKNSEFKKMCPCAEIAIDAWRKGRVWGRFKDNIALMEITSLYGSYALSGVLEPDEALEEISKAFTTLIKKEIKLMKSFHLKDS
jgi:ABC-type glycerol-3-phosphate transport system substrate-binding protein